MNPTAAPLVPTTMAPPTPPGSTEAEAEVEARADESDGRPTRPDHHGSAHPRTWRPRANACPGDRSPRWTPVRTGEEAGRPYETAQKPGAGLDDASAGVSRTLPLLPASNAVPVSIPSCTSDHACARHETGGNSDLAGGLARGLASCSGLTSDGAHEHPN